MNSPGFFGSFCLTPSDSGTIPSGILISEGTEDLDTTTHVSSFGGWETPVSFLFGLDLGGQCLLSYFLLDCGIQLFNIEIRFSEHGFKSINLGLGVCPSTGNINMAPTLSLVTGCCFLQFTSNTDMA